MGYAVVLGRASTVWDELEEVRKIRQPDLVVAVNVAGRDYPGKIDHWVSFHAELFFKWLDERRALGHPEPGLLWSGIHRGKKLGEGLGLPLNYVDIKGGGSSGMMGVLVALQFMPRAVLCGVPLDNSPRFDDPTGWKEFHAYRAAWKRELPMLSTRVRSMSGWTKDLLGYPYQEWIDGK